MLLRDKVCVIVGASSLRGIGYATAELFAHNGARLALVDLNMDEGIVGDIASSIAKSIGRQPIIAGLKCDIQNPVDCERAVADMVTRFGTMDCLVNCAGIVQARAMLSIVEALITTGSLASTSRAPSISARVHCASSPRRRPESSSIWHRSPRSAAAALSVAPTTPRPKAVSSA